MVGDWSEKWAEDVSPVVCNDCLDEYAYFTFGISLGESLDSLSAEADAEGAAPDEAGGSHRRHLKRAREDA